MDEHFRAFTFVDRIHSVEPGVRIHGSYTIPARLATFSTSLVAEAVGQLAAWAAMAAVDFKFRPVAGLAGSIDLLSPVRPGQVLDLAAELETVDTEAAAYVGTAHAGGIPVIRLQHCVGPMLLVEEFDDPQALRERFALLQGDSVARGTFGGGPFFALECTGGEAGQSLRATLQVPKSAPFFADHFPRRPVFPGTLLMNAKLEVVAALAAQWPAPAGGRKWTPRRVTDMKIRTFTPPGETVAIEARLHQLSPEAATVTVETRNGQRAISAVRVRLEPEETA